MENLLLLINLKIIIPLIPFRVFFFLFLFFSGTNSCPKNSVCLIQTEIKSMAYILAAPTAIIISPWLCSCLVSHMGHKPFKTLLKNFIFMAFFLSVRGMRFVWSAKRKGGVILVSCACLNEIVGKEMKTMRPGDMWKNALLRPHWCVS